MPTRAEKYHLLGTLRDTSDGKLFLEKEYAFCTKMYCEMLEEDGETEKATTTIQEIQIETYGSVEAKDKVVFILYQMKLVLLRKDFVRCQILSRKISKKNLNQEGYEALKIQFYEFMVMYFIHEKMHLDTAKAFQTMYDTFKAHANVDTTGNLKNIAFQNFIVYLLICNHSNEKVDLLHITQNNYPRELEANQFLQKYVNKFLVFELMPLNEETLHQEISVYEPFQEKTEHHRTHVQEFTKQLIQHNIRVIEKYYTRINLDRISQLVGVSRSRVEVEIGDMVVNARITAKINRLSGIVVFQKNKFTNDILNDWNYDIRTLLDKIEQTCHLINREKVVHQ